MLIKYCLSTLTFCRESSCYHLPVHLSELRALNAEEEVASSLSFISVPALGVSWIARLFGLWVIRKRKSSLGLFGMLQCLNRADPLAFYAVGQNTFCVSLLDTFHHLQNRFLLPDVLSK